MAGQPTVDCELGGVFRESGFPQAMIVIRRQVDRTRAYTAIFLPGEPPRVFPTSDYEHARILQIYKQDRPYTGIENDFTDSFPTALPGPGANGVPPVGPTPLP
jgi:hypothetical protein